MRIQVQQDDGMFAYVDVKDLIPETGASAEFLNLSTNFLLMTRGGDIIPSKRLIQGVINGTEARVQGKFVITKSWDDGDVPSGEWMIRPSGIAVPSRQFDLYSVAVGPMVLNRGYHQRGLSGGNVLFELKEETDPASEVVMTPRWGMSNPATQNRVRGDWPFKVEVGSELVFAIRYQI